jgi:KaiC/GvpD/RAD55 family RecA-like ATPase
MPLNFGIPSLDSLIEIPQVKRNPSHDAESLAILGPDGSGKSVLALHLASRYLADAHRVLPSATALPKVVYVSTDLKYSSASKVWENFDLGKPNQRQIPFEGIWESMVRLGVTTDPAKKTKELKIELKKFSPGEPRAKKPDDNHILSYLQNPTNNNEQTASVAFLDLAADTAGDDWTFTNSLIAQLSAISEPKDPPLKHLVIVDSVAGFETFVGKLDAHGEEQSRRARIAQCMRNAGTHCHIVFVVEEPVGEERLPEEYVTDVVVRLRLLNSSTRVERTVEVEKARARQHAVGQHPFEIRGKQGTSTGDWENPDTPIAKNGYVQVFPTLQHRYAGTAMASGLGKLQQSRFVAPFGLPYLDPLLLPGDCVNNNPEPANSGDAQSKSQSHGLRCGTVTAIIGDSSTGKSDLATKLLAEGFRTLVHDWIVLHDGLVGPNNLSDEEKKTFKETLHKYLTYLSQPTPPVKQDTTSRNEQIESWFEKDGVNDLRKNCITEVNKAWEAGESASEESLKEIINDKARGTALVGRPEINNSNETHFHKTKYRKDIWTAFNLKPEEDVKRTQFQQKTQFQVLEDDWKNLNEDGDVLNILKHVFSHPNCRFPGVLLTTADRKASEIAKACLEYLKSERGKNFTSDCEKALQTAIESQLIVRRFDIDTSSTAAIIHLIQRNIYAAQTMIFGHYYPPRGADRSPKSARIRLVIDDFRVLSSMCPAVQRDPLFLPYLTFHLEREGITSLIVYTDAVRPDRRPTDEISRTLISLVSHTIYLWAVPFEGRNRIAFTVVPPSSDTNNGVIRELVLTNESNHNAPGIRVPQATPHFELYSGIEEGRPKLVPLAVYLFDEARRFQEYVQREDAIFRELFVAYSDPNSTTTGQILFPLTAKRYEALRDFAHLPSDTQDGHTIVMQVDGYWSMGADRSLNSMYDYLFDPLENDDSLRRHEDPYSLFREKPLSKNFTNAQAESKPNQRNQRIQFFANQYYRSRLMDFGRKHPLSPDKPDRDKPDRVPFMWDFSFVLTRTGPWALARNQKLQCRLHHSAGSESSEQNGHKTEATQNPVSVGQVFDFFTGKKSDANESAPNQQARDKVWPKHGWRYFLEACQMVANNFQKTTGTAVVPFDLAVPSGETITCLFLEIWLSELDQIVKADDKIGDTLLWSVCRSRLSKDDYNPDDVVPLLDLLNVGTDGKQPLKKWVEDFKQWVEYRKNLAQYRNAKAKNLPPKAVPNPSRRAHVPKGFIALYKTWLLLLEALDFRGLCDANDAFSLTASRECPANAIASRHWYKSACDFSARIQSEQGVHDGVSLLRIPGNFSTRGDWFLASSKGSRSRRLGQHAIDLLSSRRANLTRMQLGLGLPVRDVLEDPGIDFLRTALQCEIDGEQKPVLYKNLVTRCGIPPKQTNQGTTQSSGQNNPPQLSWLWRSSFTDYDRQSRVLQKWLARVFQWTIQYKERRPKNWAGGFDAYDQITGNQYEAFAEYESALEFADHCDLLRYELKAALRTSVLTKS